MELKLSKKIWANRVEPDEYNPNPNYRMVGNTTLLLKSETKNDYIFTNVSAGDVECLAIQFDSDGMTIKSRYVKRFVTYDNTEWRG